MFTVADRDRLHDYVVAMGERDDRIVAAALVGSLAGDSSDRWSDIDLSFAVDEGIDVNEVLEDWTPEIIEAFDAVLLFDLPVRSMVYRVFLMPECLQLDISMAPASDFRPTSPRFRLLFGSAGPPVPPSPPPVGDLLGWAMLWARHGRVCIERGHFWQAEYCISELRRNSLALACIKHDLPASYGKGFDHLPADIRDRFLPALVVSLDENALSRALRSAIDAFIELQSDDISEVAVARLREAATG